MNKSVHLRLNGAALYRRLSSLRRAALHAACGEKPRRASWLVISRCSPAQAFRRLDSLRYSAALLAIFLVSLFPALVHAQSPVPPISSGYGAPGSFNINEEKFANPLFREETVHVFRPANVAAPSPVIFFAPGFGNNDPDAYGPLINHLVSRGHALVYSPFPIAPGDFNLHGKRYDAIFAGFEEAARRYGSSFDLTRVAFAGHSFGGGASFAMMQRGAVEKGWGKNGLFLFVMAPWYVYEVTTRQLINLPPHAKVLVQVYESDTICDHRIAKEVFERVGLPATEKDFVLLRNDASGSYELEASHGTPGGGTPNALDYYGVWRLFDALADYSFNNNPAGKAVALGKGGATQRFMGRWPNGQAVKELLAGDCVPLTRASSSFLFRYDQTIHELSSVSAASFQTTGAPESLATIYGKLLADAAATAPTPGIVLNDTYVKVRDSACIERLAPLFYVSPTQINYQIPPGAASGAATIIAYNRTGAVSLGALNIRAVAPGLFTANADGRGVAAGVALRVKADGQQSYEALARYDEIGKRFVAAPLDLSQINEQVFLILFGTGWRQRSSLASVVVSIGGVNVETSFAGAQGALLGLDQLNVKLPRTLVGRGEVELVLRVEGQAANPVRVSFR